MKLLKFIAYFSLPLLLFSLCNSEPLLDGLGLIPIPDSMCGASDAPLVTCAFVAVFYAYISLICRALYTSGDVTETLACLVDEVPVPFNTVFTSILGGVANGTLTTAEVCPSFDIWHTEISPICPVILLPILDILQDLSDGDPSELTCSENGISELACTIIEGYSLTVRLLCALDQALVGIIEWDNFLTCVVDQLPVGLQSLGTEVVYGLLNGLQITGAPCSEAIGYFNERVDSMCPGLFDSTNDLLAQILNLI